MLSPLSGYAISLEDINSAVYNLQFLGQGAGLKLTGSTLLAPFGGKLSALVLPERMIQLTAENGLRLQIQIGINLPLQHGEGIYTNVKPGDCFKQGERLVEFNLLQLKQQSNDIICAITILNSHKLAAILPHYQKVMAGQDPLFTLTI